MTTSASLVATMFVLSCGTSSPRPPIQAAGGQAPAPTSSSLSRFAETLRNGGSLYGVGVGCDEWRATRSDEKVDQGEWIRGDLAAQRAHEGRMYGFSYDVLEQQDVVRLSIVGRGSWSPAPGVTVPAAGPNGEGNWVTIGSGSYCIEKVDARPSPVSADAILVGEETWFMTEEACSKHRRGPDIVRCSAKGKRSPQSK